jgi:hypothetical protein
MCLLVRIDTCGRGDIDWLVPIDICGRGVIDVDRLVRIGIGWLVCIELGWLARIDTCGRANIDWLVRIDICWLARIDPCGRGDVDCLARIDICSPDAIGTCWLLPSDVRWLGRRGGLASLIGEHRGVVERILDNNWPDVNGANRRRGRSLARFFRQIPVTLLSGLSYHRDYRALILRITLPWIQARACGFAES